MSRRKIIKAIDHRLEQIERTMTVIEGKPGTSSVWMEYRDRADELQTLKSYIEEHIPDHAATTIKVWRKEDAPEKYLKLAPDFAGTHVAFIPTALKGNDPFGHASYQVKCSVEDGEVIFVWQT